MPASKDSSVSTPLRSVATTSNDFANCMTEMSRLKVAVDDTQHRVQCSTDESSLIHDSYEKLTSAGNLHTRRSDHLFRNTSSIKIKPGKLSPALLQCHETEINKSKPEPRSNLSASRRVMPISKILAQFQQPLPISNSNRNLYSSKLTISTSSGANRPRMPTILSPSGPTAGKLVDTSLSLKRYSLFGPNVAPFWEYYIGISGVSAIPLDTPSWRVAAIQKRNCHIVHSYMRKEEILRRRREFERIEQERRTCVPEWMREIVERRRRKLPQSDGSTRYGQHHHDPTAAAQQVKEDIPPWKKELILKKRRKHLAEKKKSM